MKTKLKQPDLTGDDDQLMRRRWVESVSGLCERQLRTLEAERKFPSRTKIAEGGQAVGWSKLEVQAWVRERLAARNGSVAA